MNVFPFSGSERAQFLNTTSSSHRLFTCKNTNIFINFCTEWLAGVNFILRYRIAIYHFIFGKVQKVQKLSIFLSTNLRVIIK